MVLFPQSLIRWKGSKTRMRRHLLPILEEIEHRCYCEPFGGSAAILLNKKPSELEVYNDVNGGLCALFRSLKNPTHNAQLAELLRFTPISRRDRDDLLILIREYLKKGAINQEIREQLTLTDYPDEVCAAYAMYYTQNLGFGGKPSDVYLASSYSMTERHLTYWRRLELFPAALHRLKDVIVENQDYKWILAAYDSPHTLFFIDPPYCTGSEEYGAGWNQNDEKDLCDMLLSCKGSVVLTCYDTPTYNGMLTRENGFRKLAIDNVVSICRDTTKRRATVESVYIKRVNKAGKVAPVDLFALSGAGEVE